MLPVKRCTVLSENAALPVPSGSKVSGSMDLHGVCLLKLKRGVSVSLSEAFQS